jgi:hypothetical protein
MSLKDELETDQEQDTTQRRRIRQLEATLRRRDEELATSQRVLGILEQIEGVSKPPKWTRPSRRKLGQKGIVTLQLTDTHFDEIVRPEEVAYINAYDRHIAELRLKRWAEKAIALARDYVAGVELEGVVVFATGDVMSGDIHDELKESNESTLYEGADHWVGQLYAALQLLVEEFGRLHIAAVVGNHGRNSRKPVYKRRAQSNIEWFMWRQIARMFSTDERVTVQVSDSMDLTVPIYATNYLITHGDEFRGGSGIQGARAPLALGQHRTSVRQMATAEPMDYLVVGHFHQFQPPAQGLIMGGSLKGYDEYAFGKRFRPEPPIQGFWITTPDYGPTISAPIYVSDRKAEGW